MSAPSANLAEDLAEGLAAEPAGEQQGRRFVTALARGLSVLASFEPGRGGLANHDIAAACGLPRSAVSPLALSRSAMGRASVAVCPEPERAAIYEDLKALDPVAWPQVRRRLDRAVAEHREIGCCTACGEWRETVCAIALGFHPGGGLPPMSVNCGAPAVIADARFLMEVARPRLIAAVRGLDGVMGA